MIKEGKDYVFYKMCSGFSANFKNKDLLKNDHYQLCIDKMDPVSH